MNAVISRALAASVFAAGLALGPTAILAMNGGTYPQPHPKGSQISDHLPGLMIPIDGDLNGGAAPSVSWTATNNSDGSVTVWFGDGSYGYQAADGSGLYMQIDGTSFAWDSAGIVQWDVTEVTPL